MARPPSETGLQGPQEAPLALRVSSPGEGRSRPLQMRSETLRRRVLQGVDFLPYAQPQRPAERLFRGPSALLPDSGQQVDNHLRTLCRARHTGNRNPQSSTPSRGPTSALWIGVHNPRSSPGLSTGARPIPTPPTRAQVPLDLALASTQRRVLHNPRPPLLRRRILNSSRGSEPRPGTHWGKPTTSCP